MAVTKVNARDFTFELSDGDPTPTWTPIGGITTMTLSRNQEEADNTTFDSNGIPEHYVMSRGRSFSVEGKYLEDPADGTRDPGQAAVEALADLTGPNSLRELRITTPGGTTLTQSVSARLGDVGGGTNDTASWGVEFVRSGDTTVA